MPTSEVSLASCFVALAAAALLLSGFMAHRGFSRWPADRDVFLWLLPLLLLIIGVAALAIGLPRLTLG